MPDPIHLLLDGETITADTEEPSWQLTLRYGLEIQRQYEELA